MNRRWRDVRDAATDLFLFLTGRRERDLPPHRFRRVGQGDFRKMGEILAAMLVEHGLRPDDRVLDIGCGVGRVALALTRVLSSSGNYVGFDADARAIRWCSENITPRHANFRFAHAAVETSRQHRQHLDVKEYRFPTGDASIDFAFATSVFTHLEFEAAVHYASEARRVLRPGGILLATIFVWDGSPASLPFPFPATRSRLMELRDRGRGVAFEEEALGEIFPPSEWADVHLKKRGWRTTGSFSILGQDVLTARKV